MPSRPVWMFRRKSFEIILVEIVVSRFIFNLCWHTSTVPLNSNRNLFTDHIFINIRFRNRFLFLSHHFAADKTSFLLFTALFFFNWSSFRLNVLPDLWFLFLLRFLRFFNFHSFNKNSHLWILQWLLWLRWIWRNLTKLEFFAILIPSSSEIHCFPFFYVLLHNVRVLHAAELLRVFGVSLLAVILVSLALPIGIGIFSLFLSVKMHWLFVWNHFN